MFVKDFSMKLQVSKIPFKIFVDPYIYILYKVWEAVLRGKNQNYNLKTNNLKRNSKELQIETCSSPLEAKQYCIENYFENILYLNTEYFII